MLIKSIVKETLFCMMLVLCTSGELMFNNLKIKLALELFKAVPEKNLVVSAFMVRFPLCKLASVATGEAKTELMTSLGFTNDSWLLGCYARFKNILEPMSKLDLWYSNKIYVNYSNIIDPDFLRQSYFGVPVEKVGFNYPRTAAKFINQGISAATFKHITDVIDTNDIDSNTSMIIASGIYFKGTWETPFNFKLTKQEMFYHKAGKVSKVQMMMKIDTMQYVDAGEFQAVKLHFGFTQTSISLILPFDRKSLQHLVDSAYKDPNYFTPFFDRMRYRNVRLKMPRFQIKTYVDWTGFLQEMGLYAIFNCTSSDLATILKEEYRVVNSMCLNKMKQRVFIHVDEMGISRHIQRGGPDDMLQPNAPIIDAVDVTLDRPFLFTINIDPMLTAISC